MTLALLVPVSLQAAPARAQTAAAAGGEAEDAQCRRQREAALISGEIVVCAEPGDDARFRLRSDDEAASAYAEATINKGQARKPDFAPPPCRPGLLTFCPKFGGAPPRAIEVDFSKLPEAPQGSDAAKLNEEAPER